MKLKLNSRPLKRLKERGREKGELFNERIERARNIQTFPEADYVIDNSGDINNAVNQFINYISLSVKEK